MFGDRRKIPSIVQLVVDVLGEWCTRNNRKAVVRDVLPHDRVREEEYDRCCTREGEGGECILGLLDCRNEMRSDFDEPGAFNPSPPTWYFCTRGTFGNATEVQLPVVMCEAEASCAMLS